jgi:ketosteroid isomerase-like protein
MSVADENKRVVSSFFENVTAGKIDEAFALVDDGVKWWVPGALPFSGTKTKSEYMKIVGMIRAGFPTGFSLTVRDTTVEGARVAAEVESAGRHVNGKAYNNKYHFLMVLKDGKISEVKEYMDTLHLFQLIQK